jgi:hypothetical protein
MYHFHPPFFIVNTESSFADSWEVFCCKLLNLENRTAEIHRRLPPENGVDLFYPDQKIAYQCKSIENGLASGFNLAKVRNSYNSALTIKESLGWTQYIVCVNTDLTGAQQDNFQKELPGVGLLTKSHWTSLCHKFPGIVQDNFRRIISITPQKMEEKIKNKFPGSYPNHLKEMLKNDSFDLLFYSNRHNSVYRIPVSKQFKISDLLDILRVFFNLPTSKNDAWGGGEVSISYSIVCEDKDIAPGKTIEAAGLTEHSIICFWHKLRYTDNSGGLSDIGMFYRATPSMSRSFRRPPTSTEIKRALEDCKDEISNCFIQADRMLEAAIIAGPDGRIPTD